MASIVDYLNKQGQDSSFSSRQKLAETSGITNYKGTAEQNIELLNKLQNPVNTQTTVPQVNIPSDSEYLQDKPKPIDRESDPIWKKVKEQYGYSGASDAYLNTMYNAAKAKTSQNVNQSIYGETKTQEELNKERGYTTPTKTSTKETFSKEDELKKTITEQQKQIEELKKGTIASSTETQKQKIVAPDLSSIVSKLRTSETEDNRKKAFQAIYDSGIQDPVKIQQKFNELAKQGGFNSTNWGEISKWAGTDVNAPIKSEEERAKIYGEKPAVSENPVDKILKNISSSIDYETIKNSKNTSGAGDWYDQLTQMQIDQLSETQQQEVAYLKRREILAKASYDSSLKSAEADKKTLLDIAKQQKDLSEYGNNLDKNEMNAQASEKIAIMKDNNSRLEGYMKAKLAAAGSLDGGVGLEVLGKAMAMSDMALQSEERNAKYIQEKFALAGRQIQKDYFTQSFEIIKNYTNAVATANNTFTEQLNKIDESVILSNKTKNEQTMALIKNAVDRGDKLKAQAHQETMDNLNYNLNRLKYDHDILRDAKDYSLKVEELNLKKQEMRDDSTKAEMARVKGLVDSGILSKDAMNQFLTEGDVLTNSNYYSKSGSFNIADKVGDVIKKITDGNVGDGIYECVQFVRDVIPDLPTGLFTIGDKIKKLLNVPGSIPSPQTGSVVVMDYGNTAGHIALVTSVDENNKKFTVSEFNRIKGAYSTNTISFDDPKIKGYWMSKNVQNTSRILPLNVENRVQGIISSFNKSPIVANYRKVSTDLTPALSLDPYTATAADKKLLIYTFARVMDPDTGVREGEYKSVGQGTRSMFDNFKLEGEKIFSTPGELDAKGVKMLQDTLKSKYQGFFKQFEEAKKGEAYKIDRYGVSNYGQSGEDIINKGITIFDPVQEDIDTQNAIQLLKDNGYDVTEGNINKILESQNNIQ